MYNKKCIVNIPNNKYKRPNTHLPTVFSHKLEKLDFFYNHSAGAAAAIANTCCTYFSIFIFKNRN